MSGPLEGIQVLEFAEYGFVPAGAAALADWGADVVKIERPEGDPLRQVSLSGTVERAGDFDYPVEICNRNKRGIGLDLRAPGARELFDRLVGWADVFITNQLPRTLRRFRLEPADLMAVNPPRRERCAELYEMLSAAFLSKPLSHWEPRLREEDCIFSKFASPEEVVHDPQVEINGYLPEHPSIPGARLPATPQQFDDQPVVIRCGAPGLGEHTDEVLRELGLAEAEIAELRAAKAVC